MGCIFTIPPPTREPNTPFRRGEILCFITLIIFKIAGAQIQMFTPLGFLGTIYGAVIRSLVEMQAPPSISIPPRSRPRPRPVLCSALCVQLLLFAAVVALASTRSMGWDQHQHARRHVAGTT